MGWAVRIAEDAQIFVERLPDKARRQVSRSISQLEERIKTYEELIAQTRRKK